MKQLFKYSLTLPALLLLSSCDLSSLGGGSGDVETATAYYYNIQGVEYDCGDAPKGTTGSDGAFDYEIGKGCTFYVGGKELREVSYRDLSEGIVFVETNDETMQFLMTLDNDGSVDTGIKVLSSVSDYLETQNMIDDFLIPSFISDAITVSDSTMATLYSALALSASGYDGEYATYHEARNYIDDTVAQLSSEGIAFIELR